jgi:6,7-dimethyl-8-ribityllumazine synthase
MSMQLQPGTFPRGRKVAVVASRYNEDVTSRLLDGALARLRERGIPDEDVDVARVPGAFEIPGIAKRLALTGRYAAIVCIGAVIRGETPHFEYICQASAYGIVEVGLETGVPCSFGVITCDSEEQALSRTGGLMGHKGKEAADAAVEMASLYASVGPVMA